MMTLRDVPGMNDERIIFLMSQRQKKDPSGPTNAQWNAFSTLDMTM